MSKPLLLIFFLLIIKHLHADIPAADNQYTISQITNNEGLSNSAVNCIFEDHQGILWIGTWDGLNRFNGNDIELYKPRPGEERSISHHIIRRILEDGSNGLWISTDRGINRFNRATREFERYLFQDGNSPIKENSFFIDIDSGKNLFCAVEDWGIGYFSHPDGKFIKLSNTIKHIRDFKIAGDNFWIADYSGSIIYGRISCTGPPEFTELDRITLPSLDVAQILRAGEEHVVFRDVIGDIYRYNKTNKSTSRLKSDITVYSSGDIDHIYRRPGRIHPGMKIHGLLDLHESDMKGMRSAVHVLSSLKSKDGILWIGTDGHGIIKVFPNNKLFHVISGNEIFHALNSTVRAILPDKGDLWLGTKGGALLKVSPFFPGKPIGSRQIRLFTEESGVNKNVFAIARGIHNEIWIGSDDYGIAMIDPETEKIFKIAPGDPAGKLFKSVYCIIANSDGSLWLGTSGYGLIHIKLEKEGQYLKSLYFKRYRHEPGNPNSLSNNVVYTIHPAKNGGLWIGTRGGGLNYFEPDKGAFNVFKHRSSDSSSLSNNDILCLHEDNKGSLWIGTSGGLNKITHPATISNIRFQSYTEADGLKNNTIHGIQSDELGTLWLSTNKGIARFNPWSETFKNYSYQDGLQSNEFADGAHYYDPGTSLFYFGGINGLTYFRVNEIKESSTLPRTEITGIEVLNRNASEGKSAFYADIVDKKQITLKHSQNYFKVSFRAINYTRSEKCLYKYKLAGFDNNWLYTNNLNNSATYSNIPPGSYTFIVFSSNEDGYWSSVETSFDVRILPPAWKSPPAYLLYFLIAGILVYLIFIVLRKRTEFKRTILIEKLRHEKEEEVYNSKIQFFTNITHEFCTPLTLITSPAEKLYNYEHADNYIREKSTIIQDNAKRLLRLFQELLYFRKIEDKEVELSVKEVDVVQAVRNIARQFKEITDPRGIRFVAKTPDRMLVSTDTGMLEKIILNLLSNSFKHTSKGDLIRLDLKKRDDHFFEIEISDTGDGIDSTRLPYIFDRYNSFENHNSSGQPLPSFGIGLSYTKSLIELLHGTVLVKSKREQGSTFIVKLPRHVKRPQHQKNTIKSAADAWSQDSLFDHLKNPDYSDRPAIEEVLYRGRDRHLPKLLIIDDEPAIRKEIKEIFTEKFAVYEASNASDGLKFSKILHPDLIILDVIMPGKSGLDLCLAVRQDFHLSHIPVVMLTAKTSIEQEVEGLNCGADAYVRKPFRTEHLKVVVESVFQNRQRIKNFFGNVSYIKQTVHNDTFSDIDKDFLSKTIEIIEANIEKEDISIHSICEQLSVSKMQFYRKLKELTGKSPAEFIRNIKLLRSAELLRKTKLSIKEIYYACGFNNRSYFCREFKNSFGSTPTEYRDRERSVVQ